MKFPNDIKALKAHYKQNEEIGANFIGSMEEDDEDDEKPPTDSDDSSCCSQNKDEDHIHEILPVDYDAIEIKYKFNYDQFKLMRKEFPENKKLIGLGMSSD